MRNNYRIIRVDNGRRTWYEIKYKTSLFLGLYIWQGYGTDYTTWKYETEKEAKQEVDILKQYKKEKRTIVWK